MGDLALKFIIEAENRSGVILDQFGRAATGQINELSTASAGASRALQHMHGRAAEADGALKTAAKSARLLAVPLAMELSPALGQTAAQMTSAIATSTMLATGLTALGLAAASVAAIVIGRYVEAWEKAKTAQLEFNRAMASMDVGRMTGEIDKATKKIEELRDELEELKKSASGPFGRGWRDLWGVISAGPGDFEENERRTLEQADRIRLARERARIAEGDAAFRSSFAAIDVARAEHARRFFALERDQAGLMDFQLVDPIEMEYRASMREARELRSDLQPEAAARLTRAAGIKRRRAMDDARFYARLGAQAGLEAPFADVFGPPAGGIGRVDVDAALEARRVELGLAEPTAETFFRGLGGASKRARLGAQAAAEAPYAEAAGAGGPMDPAEIKRIQTELLTVKLQGLAVDREALEIAGRMSGLTEDERTALETTLSLERERLRIAELDAQIAAEKDERRKDVLRRQRDIAALEGSVTRTNLAREALERNDPVAGFARGMRDMQEDYLASGRQLLQATREIGSAMARTWSDVFFTTVTGEWKKLNELPRQFALAALRSMTDVAGRMMTGFVGQAIWPGATRAMGLGVPMMMAGAGAAAPLIQVAAGQALPAGYQAIGTAPNGAVLAAPVTAAGPGVSLSQVPLPPSGAVGGGSFLPVGVQSLLDTPVAALFSSSAALEAEGAALMSMSASGATSSTAGLTIGQALGGAAAVAGLAFTVWSALQAPPTPQNIIMSGASGAISGAVIGSLIYPGVGTAIGAIAGGLIGGGAAAFGKGGVKEAKKFRQAKEAGRATGMARSLIAEVSGATDMEQLHGILTKYNSGAVGGSTPVAIVTTVRVNGVAKLIGRPNPSYPVATVEELGLYSDSFAASIQAGVSPSLLDESNRAVEAAVKQKVEQLIDREASIPFGYIETVDTPGGPVERRTFLPIRALLAATNQTSIFASTELLRRDLGLTDEEIARIFERLRTVAFAQGLILDLTRDDFLAESV